MRPVSELPITSGNNKIIATKIRLHNGTEHWARLCNVALKDIRRTQQFIGVSVSCSDKWFHLARYFDVDYDERSPAKLALFLGLPVGDVFPIKYDISDVALGIPEVVRGTIHEQPAERLSLSERIVLARGLD